MTSMVDRLSNTVTKVPQVSEAFLHLVESVVVLLSCKCVLRWYIIDRVTPKNQYFCNTCAYACVCIQLHCHTVDTFFR